MNLISARVWYDMQKGDFIRAEKHYVQALQAQITIFETSIYGVTQEKLMSLREELWEHEARK